jgi:hypothetical protein
MALISLFEHYYQNLEHNIAGKPPKEPAHSSLCQALQVTQNS